MLSVQEPESNSVQPRDLTSSEPPSVQRGLSSLDDYLETIEKQEIIAAMEKNRWNKTEAAKQLGISFRSLRYRMKKLKLED